MKHIRLFLMILSTVLILGMGEKPDTISSTLIEHNKVLIKVNGMTCSMCAQGIEKKLKEHDTVQSISVDFENKLIEITYQKANKLTDKHIKDAIYYAGYELVSIERL
ncbi:hypothetical protein DID76_00200 [Candidatus Marinamargulisbacteria bacterium SCGC AG-414-C22]|nr:hypothetical protein DID76_00200 [Candidatus Marinamargulisbacteria bacterium SCGC AG-414-C22]